MKNYLSTRFDTRHMALFACCLLLVILAVADRFTRHEIHLSFLYIVPVAVAAWFSGRRTAVLMSIVSAIVWFLVDISSEIAIGHGVIHLWNIVIRTVFFLLITYGITLLSSAIHRQNELVEFIVHDLKAPLANATSALENIRDAAGADARINSFVNIALISTKRMFTLIHSIIDLAKLEKGSLAPKMEETSAEAIIDDAVSQVSMWAEKNGIGILRRNETTRARVRTDHWLVVRILTNLLSNAIKASPPNSKIEALARDGASGALVFSVRDEGHGISKEWIKGVFDKFHQVQMKKQGIYVGSGLGLTFCKLAVTALGGKIWMESEQEKGTTASFEILV